MNLKGLKLTDYRNCEDLELIFDKNKILIIGKKCTGKNQHSGEHLFLSTLKSPRTSNPLELIKFSKRLFQIRG